MNETDRDLLEHVADTIEKLHHAWFEGLPEELSNEEEVLSANLSWSVFALKAMLEGDEATAKKFLDSYHVAAAAMLNSGRAPN